MTKRQENILNAVIHEHIKSARPVSSRLLEKRHRFGLSPAMIRIEMQKLTDYGLLIQPHTSAGRIPTDKGYRFFVNSLLKKKAKEFKGVLGFEDLLEGGIEDYFKFSSQLAKFISHASSNFAFLHFQKENLSWKEGWEEIIQEPEFEDKDFLVGFSEFLEDFEEGVDALEFNSGIKIYIGGENPFDKSKDFSIMTTKCFLPGGKETILSILGPKRMDYDKNIGLMNYLREALDNF